MTKILINHVENISQCLKKAKNELDRLGREIPKIEQNALANIRLTNRGEELLVKSKQLLHRLDEITADEFSNGGEQEERNALRKLILEIEGLDSDY